MSLRHPLVGALRPSVLAVFLLLSALAGPEAVRAQIPGQSVEQGPGLRAEWEIYTRTLADSLLRDLITAAERREHETLAQLFTDRAVLIEGNGQYAVGRTAIRDLMTRLPERSGYIVQVSDARAGTRLLYASGRIHFEEAGTEKVQTFAALLEPHHGRWQIRSLAHAPVDDPQAYSRMPSQAVTAHGRRVRAPERRLVRIIFEPFAEREHRMEVAPDAPWTGFGAGVGMEIDRALELRGFGWRQQNPSSLEPMSSYGVEARLFLFERWRLRPFLSIGAVKFEGAAAPDTAWVPTPGGGLSVRLFSHLDLQVSARSHLVAKQDGVRESTWIVEKRSQRPAISAGLSLALGRRPAWRDSKPGPEVLAYQATVTPQVLETLSSWEAVLRTPGGAVGNDVYAPGAVLYMDGAAYQGGREILVALQSRIQGQTLQVREVYASGDVAYAETSVFDPGGESQLVTVLQREGRQWRIRAQMLP